ncbi:expressed protein [Echinococcus multilocularis]|uniref:Expressed protein n=1 Tax=Echinococcus multilocularis TaxID=6211 RepID=A0A068Y1R9_ECHMU|nr:expressed protein [Echinococcus multilocularis]
MGTTPIEKCKYDAVKCRVALNNAELEDGVHNIYEKPVNQEPSDPGDPSYANAQNFNTTEHQVIRPKNPVRRSVSYEGLDASEMVWRAHESCNYQDDTFDESEISPMVQRSPKLGDDSTGEHTSTLDLPEHLLILTPRPIHKITVFGPDAPGVEFCACESRDYKGDKGALNAPKLPNLCNDFANAYVSPPLPPKPIVHRTEGEEQGESQTH